MSMTHAIQMPTGVWLPMITPFTQGRLDEPSIRNLIRHYSTTGLSGFILGATTGESMALSPGEAHRLVTVAQEVNKGHLPIFLGQCGSDTNDMVSTIRQTNEWNINGYLITVPYYVRPTQEGLFQHYTALADASRHPILMYNIPYRTGVNMTNDTVRRLAEHPQIVGIKDCCAIRDQSLDLIQNRRSDFSVLVGDDANFFDYVQAGADGGILASAHLEPSAYTAIYHALRAGNPQTVQDIWDGFAPHLPLLFKDPNPNPGPVKMLLAERGIIASDEVRLPLTRPEDASKSVISHAFANCSFA
ncbi:MAG: 4-hydroxy-tetrahydrodipicolinate synthase [Alphaproteobacteria bacterium]|nr:4-hydroxy-tetrahydrodipicolinate synthase [Alphaproteobacteria bacterium]